MRRTKEETAAKRNSLVDAALQEFSRQGYQAARLEDIAAAAGVTRGAIYHHFGSKAGLLWALLDEASEHEHGAIQMVDVTASTRRGCQIVPRCPRLSW